MPRMCCCLWVSPLTLISLLSCSPLIDIYLTSIKFDSPITLSPLSLLTFACSNEVRKPKTHKRKGSGEAKGYYSVIIHSDSIHPVPRGTMPLLLRSCSFCYQSRIRSSKRRKRRSKEKNCRRYSSTHLITIKHNADLFEIDDAWQRV